LKFTLKSVHFDAF